MPRVGFEPTISAGERPKTYALDRAASGTGNYNPLLMINWEQILIYSLTESEITQKLPSKTSYRRKDKGGDGSGKKTRKKT